MHRPLWLLAIGLNLLGVALQILALHFGALALVQPILVCDLIFAVVIAAVFRHRRPDWMILIGVLCCAGGLAWFLAVARPHGGTTTVSLTSVIPLGVALAAVLAACLTVARASRPLRPIMLALGCGVCYGVMAFLFKILSAGSGNGFIGLLKEQHPFATRLLLQFSTLLAARCQHLLRVASRQPDVVPVDVKKVTQLDVRAVLEHVHTLWAV